MDSIAEDAFSFNSKLWIMLPLENQNRPNLRKILPTRCSPGFRLMSTSSLWRRWRRPSRPMEAWYSSNFRISSDNNNDTKCDDTWLMKNMLTSFEQSLLTIGWLWSFAGFEFFEILAFCVKSTGSGLVMNPSLNFFRSLTSIGFEKNNTSIGIPQLASPWYRFWYLKNG